MAKNAMQKQKILYLQKILFEKTDENNGITINEMIEYLSEYGIIAERKSLYDDIKNLESFGVDICVEKTDKTRYKIATRTFELPELKLLVDAIQGSKFITQKKSRALINKLESLVSDREGKQLQKQVEITNRIKSPNEKIYYYVDTLQNAVSNEKQIEFKYKKWSLNFGGEKKIVKTPSHEDDRIYIVSPWALCWNEENYYLIAYDKKADKIKHYRVDKMDSIEITNNNNDGRDKFNSFDIGKYTREVFSMFGGDKTTVKLSIDNSLVGVIADRFGTNVFITKESESTFCLSTDVVLSPQFYGWLFAMKNGIRILSPKKVKDEYLLQLNQIINEYR